MKNIKRNLCYISFITLIPVAVMVSRIVDIHIPTAEEMAMTEEVTSSYESDPEAAERANNGEDPRTEEEKEFDEERNQPIFYNLDESGELIESDE